MRVAVVILNWNGWRDAIACAESVLLSRLQPVQIYVVDNDSADDSTRHIATWLTAQPEETRVKVRVIAATRNAGYGAGNNIGIQAALSEGAEAVWILNNDTIVDPLALSSFVDCYTNSSRIGILGSVLLDFTDPNRIQSAGARYQWFLGRGVAIGQGKNVDAAASLTQRDVDSVGGASMFIPATTFGLVGLLPEHYFLYCEEVDFAERCRRAGLRIRVCADARVRHKHGAASGARRSQRARSATSTYYASRAALLVVRRFHPAFTFTAFAARLGFALQLLLLGRPTLAASATRGAMSGLTTSMPK